MRNWIVWLVAIVALGAAFGAGKLFFGLSSPGDGVSVGLDKGDIAPEIDGTDLDGKQMRLSDYRGYVVVLDFWANWCPYCRQMYPVERALVQRMNGKPFVLLGVNCQRDRQAMKAVAQKEGMTWRSWWDGVDGRIAGNWDIEGYPTIYVIDHKGIIREVYSGVPNTRELETVVFSLLEEIKDDAKAEEKDAAKATEQTPE